MFMDDGEILRDYKAAKNKKEQVKILADLNGVTCKQMAEFLVDNGMEVDERLLPKKNVSKIRCYISGKMTGNKLYKEEFQIVEDWLAERGFEPVNPAKNSCDNYREYLDLGIRQLMTCEAISIVPGWISCHSASIEREYAEAVGLAIVSMPDEVWHEKTNEVLDSKMIREYET